MIDMKLTDNVIRLAATNFEKINAHLYDAGYTPTHQTGQITIWYLQEGAIELPPEEAMVWTITERSLAIYGENGYAEVVSTTPIHMGDITVVPKSDLELTAGASMSYVDDDDDIPF